MTAVAATDRAGAAARGRPTSGAGRWRALTALARYELAAEMRGRTTPAFTAGFALAALGIALAGMAASGSLEVQGFGRTAVSLLQLSLWLVPLISLTTSAVAGADAYDMELLAAQPITRGTLVLGRALGRWATVAGSVAIGYGLAGFVIAGTAGIGDALRYVGLIATTVALAATTTALGTLAGVLARTRTRALASGIALCIAMVVGVDLAAIALLEILPRAELTWSLSALLLFNPVASARAIGVGLFDADAVAGPMGTALRRVLGDPGLALLWAGLVAWTAVPLAVAVRCFSRRDL